MGKGGTEDNSALCVLDYDAMNIVKKYGELAQKGTSTDVANLNLQSRATIDGWMNSYQQVQEPDAEEDLLKLYNDMLGVHDRENVSKILGPIGSKELQKAFLQLDFMVEDLLYEWNTKEKYNQEMVFKVKYVENGLGYS